MSNSSGNLPQSAMSARGESLTCRGSQIQSALLDWQGALLLMELFEVR
jgi:hypothetical protein